MPVVLFEKQSMMKFAILTLCLLVGIATALPDAEWLNYKSKYGKVYKNEAEDSMRKALVARQRDHIKRFNEANANEADYTLGINHLSDRTEAEMRQMRGLKLSKKRQTKRSPMSESYIQAILDDNSIEVPEEFDWRKTPGRVSRVKNQGQCGSCWAFSAVGTLEGQEQFLDKKVSSVTELSESDLVDCADENFGCNGGDPANALEFVAQEGGIDSESSYPYRPAQGPCKFNASNVVITNKGAGRVPEGNEEALKKVLLAVGPVSVGIDASLPDFQQYESGVYYNKRCSSTQLDHGVLVVGYGTDKKGGDYWIVKNSWDIHWGEKGYIRMARNKKNHCGIVSYANVPVF